MILLACAVALLGAGCLAGAGVGPHAEVPLSLVADVDLDRFMGRWYVIESIGLSAEEGAHDEVEDYRLREDGRIDIALTFREGGFDGPRRSISQLGWVVDQKTKAEWRVRPFWPLALGYWIIDLDRDYTYTVVAHPSKRWVWIMSRTPALEESTRMAIRGRLSEQGFDLSALRGIPQRTLSERAD